MKPQTKSKAEPQKKRSPRQLKQGKSPGTRQPRPDAGAPGPDGAGEYGEGSVSRRLLISDLCRTLETYLDHDTVAGIYRAYIFGAEAHEGQTRKSGEPYIYHPLEVAQILAGMHMDGKSITAAILHDVIEDTPTAKEHVAERFGEDVAELVDGVSKIGQIHFSSKEEEQAENFRKMLLAMARDIRVILIKLADRLHNMRTMEAMPREKQRKIARETMEIYAPIANRLGVRQWSYELEDLSFKYLYPLRYAVLSNTMKQRQGNRKTVVKKVREAIEERLREQTLHGTVTGREKHLYSIYRKMKEKTLSFDEIYDVYGIRITVDSVDSCYRMLGAVHNLYKPIPGRFKDYIAIPKANGYQSLHTVVFGPFGLSIEVQIRTEEMHRVADAGVAAHWLYKTSSVDEDEMQRRALVWLQDLLDIQQKAGNSREFLEHLKIDLFPDEVYVFTPQGEIKKLPRDATVVDFAYDVHTDIGNRCIGAKINHQLVPLRTRLRNGDHVEIITSEWGRPTPSWLNYVVTSRARAHIRSYLKNQRTEESVSLGERLLDKALTNLGSSIEALVDDQRQRLLDSLKIREWSKLLEQIGIGNRIAAIVARQLIETDAGKSAVPVHDLAISGTEGVVVSYAKCCRPIPGDPVLGFLSAGKGIVVHTADCPNVSDFKRHPDRWLDVEWEKSTKGVFPVSLRVETENRQGVLASVASAISGTDANIDTVTFEDQDAQYTAMRFTVEVKDRAHLAQILRRIKALDAVVKVSRIKS